MTVEEFITARVDEDERIAQSAGSGPCARWAYTGEGDSYSGGEVYLPDVDHYSKNIYPFKVTSDSEGMSPSVGPDAGQHIARHDPARVLRQVAAVRDILSLAQSAMGAHQADYEPGGTGDEAMYGYRMGAAFAYAPVMKAVAAIWSDHPDFQPEWTQ